MNLTFKRNTEVWWISVYFRQTTTFQLQWMYRCTLTKPVCYHTATHMHTHRCSYIKITKPVNSWRSLNPVTHDTQNTDRKHTDKVDCRLATLRDRQQKSYTKSIMWTNLQNHCFLFQVEISGTYSLTETEPNYPEFLVAMDIPEHALPRIIQS